MRILVTGANGFVGAKLVQKIFNDHEVVSFDLENGQNVLDFNQLKRAMDSCDIVVHLAAIKGPDESKKFEDYFELNNIGTLNVAMACLAVGAKKLIYTSSTGYYGVEIGIPYQKPIRESNLVITQRIKADDLNCRDCDLAYSTSKVIAEQILANYGLRKKFQVIILRLGPIGDKTGARWNLDGVTLKVDNAVQAIEKAINNEKNLWYEALTITDKAEGVDISKAEELLDYRPS